MKIPFFTDYFQNMSAELIVIQKLNFIIKGLTDMATKLDVDNALKALEVRYADGIAASQAGLLAQVTDLQKEIANAAFNAQEKERSDISKELHDNVSQMLTSTKLFLDILKNKKKI